MRHILIKHSTLLAGMILIFNSCIHKNLCFNHDEHAPKSYVIIDAEYEQRWQYTYDGIDWDSEKFLLESMGLTEEELRPKIPDGLRIMVYNDDGTNDIINTPTKGDTIYMRPGKHSLLFYNNDTEFIEFDDIQSFISAKATTRTRSSYNGNRYVDSKSNEVTVNPPDMLFGSYMESYTADLSTEVDSLHIVMHPLVYTYVLRFEFVGGLEYVSKARGALAGMAKSVWLNSGRTSEESATVLFDEECEIKDFGIQANVRSFGIPDFPNEHYLSRNGRTYGLTLDVLLRNGKMLSYNFDITDQMEKQPRGGIIEIKGIEITKEDAAIDSVFDVDIDDWGDYEDVDLPLDKKKKIK